MIQKNKYDSKGLASGILISLGAAGVAFLLGHYGVPYLLNTDLNCNTITVEDWQKSEFKDQFKSFDSFVQACKTSQNSLEFQVNVIPSVILPPVGFGIFFVNWCRLGWHLKDETK